MSATVVSCRVIDSLAESKKKTQNLSFHSHISQPTTFEPHIGNIVSIMSNQRWRPNDGFYNCPVVRVGNCLGEAYPKSCDPNYRPPKQDFIERILPSYVPPPFPERPTYPAMVTAGRVVRSKVRVTASTPIHEKPDEDLRRPAGLAQGSIRDMHLF